MPPVNGVCSFFFLSAVRRGPPLLLVVEGSLSSVSCRRLVPSLLAEERSLPSVIGVLCGSSLWDEFRLLNVEETVPLYQQ